MIIQFIANIALSLTIAISTPCEFEDSNNCYWNAETQGNNQGISFLDINGFAISSME